MPNSVEYYLSKGFNRPMAEYFASGRKKLVSVTPQKNFSLLLTYENGEKRVLDMIPTLLRGGVFAKLKNYELFKRVCIDDCNNIMWKTNPNIDISADFAYVESKEVSL